MRKTLAVLSLPFCFFGVAHGAALDEVKESFADSIKEDQTLVLVEGTDIFAPPGTVISMSRYEGVRKLILHARLGGDEVSLIYLPRLQVWITETTWSDSEIVRMDPRYLIAAQIGEEEVERWHTHNPLPSEGDALENLPLLILQWTMPSAEDLTQLYTDAKRVPGSRFSGNIAHIFGTTRYSGSTPGWAEPRYVSSAVRTEAGKLIREVQYETPGSLEKFAASHEGFIKLEYEAWP